MSTHTIAGHFVPQKFFSCLAGDDRLKKKKKNTCIDDADESAPVRYKIEPYLFSILLEG
jgi:hypothetical protein